MRYIETILEPGETVRYQGTVSPYVYGVTVLCILGFIGSLVILGQTGMSTAAEGYHGFFPFTTALLTFFAAPISFFVAWWRRWTTEIAVTDRRVVYKCGFIVRRAFEMNMGKIESVHVKQSLFGRLCDYGTVIIRGTGGSFEPLTMMPAPLRLRQMVNAG